MTPSVEKSGSTLVFKKLLRIPKYKPACQASKPRLPCSVALGQHDVVALARGCQQLQISPRANPGDRSPMTATSACLVPAERRGAFAVATHAVRETTPNEDHADLGDIGRPRLETCQLRCVCRSAALRI